MTGNVFEWVLDEYDGDFYLTFPQNGVAQNPLSGANSIDQLLDNYMDITSFRILRGGSWFNKPEHVRVAFRTNKSAKEHVPQPRFSLCDDY